MLFLRTAPAWDPGFVESFSWLLEAGPQAGGGGGGRVNDLW